MDVEGCMNQMAPAFFAWSTCLFLLLTLQFREDENIHFLLQILWQVVYASILSIIRFNQADESMQPQEVNVPLDLIAGGSFLPSNSREGFRKGLIAEGWCV